MFFEADAYERFMGRWSRALAPHFITFCGISEGDWVLDVGSGTGSLAFTVESATEAARIIGVDRAEFYVAYTHRQTASERVSFEVGDARKLRFEDGTFNKTLSLLVLNFIPDAPGALREMVRATRPGGLVAAAVWDYPEGMEMLRVFWDEAVAMDPATDVRDERHMPLCRKGELAALWREEGLLEVEEVPLIIPMEFSSFDDYWAPFLDGQGPAGSYVASLRRDQQTELAQRLRRRLLAQGPDGGISLKGRAWAVKGVVPRKR
jgi:SAM-dependent methyltransferase